MVNVGELSVRKHPSLDAYPMTYDCESPRGIHLHIARSPTGPWTAATHVFDAGDGYERFMQTLTLVVEDDLTGTWGFVGARGFALK